MGGDPALGIIVPIFWQIHYFLLFSVTFCQFWVFHSTHFWHQTSVTECLLCLCVWVKEITEIKEASSKMNRRAIYWKRHFPTKPRFWFVWPKIIIPLRKTPDISWELLRMDRCVEVLWKRFIAQLFLGLSPVNVTYMVHWLTEKDPPYLSNLKWIYFSRKRDLCQTMLHLMIYINEPWQLASLTLNGWTHDLWDGLQDTLNRKKHDATQVFRLSPKTGHGYKQYLETCFWVFPEVGDCINHVWTVRITNYKCPEGPDFDCSMICPCTCV